MYLYLITHLATEPQPGRSSDMWQLSAEGREQAAALRAAPFWARVEQIAVSAEPKTLLSIAPVVEARGLPVWVDCRFDELRRGGWVADYAAQVAEALARPTEPVGGWEPAAHALRRVLGGLDDLQQRFAPKTVALVGHGLTLSLLRAHWLGYERVRLEEWARLRFGAVALVELPAGRIVEDFPLAGAPVRR
ncbi:MAG TPA: histidine phosphatase family protein [Caldilineaceae bacterium]|nr:histidine phosphatase family protein [Caldilineaceae bacterium]